MNQNLDSKGSDELKKRLEEIANLKKEVVDIYKAVLKASTVILPFDHYSEEQKRLAGIVKGGKHE